MINKLLFTALLFVFTSNVFSQVPNYIPTSGLVGYWPFNGNANDESSNGNDGTVSGATLTNDRFGVADKAYSFDGIDDRIFINNPIFDNGSNFTFSGWYFLNTNINPNNGNNSHIILNTSPHNGLGLAMNWGSSNKYSLSLGSGTPSISWNILFDAQSVQNIEVQSWKFITLVKLSNTYSLYVDGVLDQIWTANNSVQTYLYKLYFGGCDPLNSNEVINGKLDDFGIWNRALTQQEITNLYTSTVPVSCLPAYVPTSGLVGYWPFCGNANDESGNGNNGTVNGAMLTNDRNGISNSCYDYNGISNQITIPNSLSLNPSEISINVWIYALSDNLAILEKGNVSNASNHGYAITHNDGWQIQRGLKSSFGDGTCSITNNIVWSDYNIFINNEWVMITVSIDNLGIIKHYKNGNLIYTSSNNSPLNSCNNPASTLRFGGPHWNNDPEWFLGKIDDIGIWNRALTQQEITNLYTSTVSPTAAVLSGDATICAGASTNLSVAVTGGTAPYTVTVTDGTNNYSATGASPLSIPVSPTATSSYTIVSVTGGGTGTGNTGTAIVTVIDATISASDSVICAGETVTLSVPQGGSSNTACAALPTNLQTGLVGYWPFCGNANDESGNGNTLNEYFVSYDADRFGNPNASFFSNGVELGQGSSMTSSTPIFNIGQSEYTIGLWVKVQNTSQVTRCLFNTIPHTGIAIGYNDNNAPGYVVYDIGPANAFWTNLYLHGPANNYQPNDWHYVVLKKQGINYSQYIDGYLDHSYINPAAANYNYDVNFRISGISPEHQIFHGNIDDIHIYNRALSEAEILQHYNLTVAEITTITYLWSNGATTPTINVSPTSTTTYTCTTTTNGVSCTDSVTVVVNNNPTIDLGSDVTLCGTSTTLTAPSGYDSYLWSNGATTNTTTVSANGTYSCTVTQGGCSASDSIDVTLIDATISASDSTICAGGTVTLSVPQGGSASIACAALPTNLQTGLVGYWPFCGNANDESGNGNNGTVNGATLTTDRFGNANSAYSFDGVNDYIVTNNISFANGGDYSISLWVKLNAAYSDGEPQHYLLSNAATLGGAYLNTDYNQSQFGCSSFYSDNSIGNWHHYVGIKSGNTYILRIDNQVVGSVNNCNTNFMNGYPIFFGNSSVNTEFTNGIIDDILIYTLALSESEIQQINTLGQTSYLWSNGATTPTINVTPTSTTTYTCTTTTNGVSCTDSVTVVVNNPTIDLGNDVTACGTSTTLTAPTGYDSYLWSNGATTNTTTVSANGTYACTVTQGGCSASDSIDVVLVPLTINTTNISAAATYTWENNGQTYTSSGIYTGITVNCETQVLNLTITPSSPTLSLQVFLDGYYINSLNPAAMTAARYNNLVASGSANPGANTDVDVITVELRSPSNLDVVAYSVSPILQTNGSVQCVFPAGALGGSFYIVVKHRAANPLWSANPIILTTSTTYDFANNLGSAYSNGDLSLAPMHTIVSSLYGIWLGELNEDGYLDATDYSNLELDIYASGYLGLYLLDGDLNGDTYVDASDFAVFESNSIYGPYEQRPYAITTNVSIGQSYQGGIVAYILQPGDAGYDANVQHGLIAAPNDQGTAQWGCTWTTAVSGAYGQAIGTGAQNTIDIMNGCSEAGIAARLCGDLVLDGYSDWYLPSLDELNKLYLNKVAIGGFAAGDFPISIYWSSTAFNNGNNDAAWGLFFYDGIQYPKAKVDYLSVRAVRAF